MLKCHPHGLGFQQRGQMLCHVLCFYSCVCNLCLPPSLNFTKIWMRNRKLNCYGLIQAGIVLLLSSDLVTMITIYLGQATNNHNFLLSASPLEIYY